LSEQPNDILTQAGLILKYLEEHFPADHRRHEALRLTEKSLPGVREQLFKLLAIQEAAGATGSDDSSSTTLFNFADPKSFGPYQVVKFVQGGGGGVVYQVFDTRLGPTPQPDNTFALKTLVVGSQEVHLRRFEEEVRSLRLQKASKFAPKFHDYGTEGLMPYLVMEFVEGQQFLDYANAQTTQHGKLRAFVTLCTAVQEMHTRGITHRDIKSGNVLVVADGTPKILDYGIARRLRGDETHVVRHTQQGEHPGTLDYMSPEQLRPGHDIDNRTDIYSLGVLLFLTLSRRFPKPSNTDLSLNTPQVKRLSPDALSECDAARLRAASPHLSAELEAVCSKALATDADHRYETAQALGEDVERYLSNEPVKAVPPSRTYYARKFIRKNRVLVASTVLVLGTLTVAAVMTTQSATKARLAAERETTALAQSRVQLNEQHGMAMTMLMDVDGSMNNIAGVLPARKNLADALSRYADKLETRNDLTPQLMIELAELRWMISRVHYQLGAAHLNQPLIAIEQLDKAAAVLARAESLPLDTRPPEAAMRRIYTMGLKGDLYDAIADRANALRVYNEADNELAELDSDSTEPGLRTGIRILRCTSACDLAGRLIAWGDVGKAGSAAQLADEMIELLRPMIAGNANLKRTEGILRQHQSAIASKERRYEDAVDLARRGQAIALDMLTRNRDVGLVIRDAMTSTDILALRLTEAGRLDEAVLAHERAVTMSRDLVEREKMSADTRKEHSVTLQNFANTLRQLQRYGDAVPLLREAVEIRSGLFAAESNPTTRGDLADTTFNFARVLMHSGSLDEALAQTLKVSALLETPQQAEQVNEGDTFLLARCLVLQADLQLQLKSVATGSTAENSAAPSQMPDELMQRASTLLALLKSDFEGRVPVLQQRILELRAGR
jgi:serine/threonine protein kinase/tetratricopeptide (TPR) repeat protein